MAARVDLAELALRESEQTEWKENVADIDDVVATLCAFANDLQNLGGGYVVCGVREERDDDGFPAPVAIGLTAARLRQVEGTVLTRCRERVSPPITPLVDELPAIGTDRRVLVFIQPASGSAHTCRRGAEGAKHFVRVGRSTIEARNGILRDLLVRKGVTEPWDRRPCSEATPDDIDLLVLREALARMGLTHRLPAEAYLSEAEQLHALVPPFCVREPLTGVLRPRNFAMLLFGRSPQRHIPGAFAYLSRYPGRDRAADFAERSELTGSLFEQADALRRMVSEQASLMMVKTNTDEPNVQRYPVRALHEALGNTLAHRDYSRPEPTRVTVFADRIEFLSPGGLPLGVSLAGLRRGDLAPRWRNQTLAWVFMRLGLAQGEGQGLATIRRLMHEAGCPPPRYEATEVDVTCTLRARSRA